MIKYVKTVILAILFSVIISLSIGIAAAETNDNDLEIFTQSQITSAQDENQDNYIQQMVMLDDTFYAYLSDESIYAWRIGSASPTFFCQLQTPPETMSSVYDDLPPEEKEQWDNTVTFLAAGDNAIWGVNVYNGKIGKIASDGIRWCDIKLDNEQYLLDEQGYPFRIAKAFVLNGMLYTYVALDNGDYPQNNYKMYAFNMADGACQALDIKNAQGICIYQTGSILLLSYTPEDQWNFDIMDLSAGTIRASEFTAFSSSDDKPVGGLAYHSDTGYLYFVSDSQVWGETEGETCSPFAFVPLTDIVGEDAAFMLTDGRYAVFNHCLYVRSVNEKNTYDDKITISGCMEDDIYQDFISENPNIPVDFSDDILSSDEIAQALVSEDQTADIYATIADNTFHSIVGKGYVADLSCSSILSSDIQTMYPNIRQAITDEAGNPVAYPYKIMLDYWTVDATLWKQIFGDTALPTTYDQFIDDMLLWETEYADEYPEVNFAGDFDFAYWIRNIVNAYAKQYWQSGSPLDINSSILRNVLEKLEKVRDIRKKNGLDIEFPESGDAIAKLNIFDTAGYNNVLLDQVETVSSDQSVDVSTDEVDASTDELVQMQTLVFTGEEQPAVSGTMIVLFVNPYSQHKALAIQYLEYATKMKNNATTYYATHPSMNEPLEKEGYEEKIQELENSDAELEEALNAADETEAVGIREELADVNAKLLSLENNKWEISEKAITSYRAYASSISFYEDNPYILNYNSTTLDKLEYLFSRYTDGEIELDDFLDELNSKLRMMYLEGQ